MDRTSFVIPAQWARFDTKEHVYPYCTVLDRTRNVTKISLRGNSYSHKACSAIARIIKTKGTIEVANLSGMFASRTERDVSLSLGALCSALSVNTNFKDVNFMYDVLNGYVGQSVAPMLRKSMNLERLILADCGMGHDGSAIIATALDVLAESCRALGRPSPLRVLVLDINQLTSKGTVLWASLLPQQALLRSLSMASNSIGTAAMAILGRALASCTQLEDLDLHDNFLVREDAMKRLDYTALDALMRSLKPIKSLRYLNLSDTQLRDGGGARLAFWLRYGDYTKLEILNLNQNDLTEDIIQPFLEAFPTLSALRLLHLANNYLSSTYGFMVPHGPPLPSILFSVDTEEVAEDEVDEDNGPLVCICGFSRCFQNELSWPNGQADSEIVTECLDLAQDQPHAVDHPPCLYGYIKARHVEKAFLGGPANNIESSARVVVKKIYLLSAEYLAKCGKYHNPVVVYFPGPFAQTDTAILKRNLHQIMMDRFSSTPANHFLQTDPTVELRAVGSALSSFIAVTWINSGIAPKVAGMLRRTGDPRLLNMVEYVHEPGHPLTTRQIVGDFVVPEELPEGD